MTPRAVRALRLALLAVVAVLSLVVGLSLRRPETTPTPERAVDAVARRHAERRRVPLLPRGQGRPVARSAATDRTAGRRHPAREAEAALRIHQPGRAPTRDRYGRFGDVHARAAAGRVPGQRAPGDGGRLRAVGRPSRLSRRHPGGAQRGPVRFERKDLSGEAVGMAYDAQAGVLELLRDVVLHVQDPDAACDDDPRDESAGRPCRGRRVLRGRDAGGPGRETASDRNGCGCTSDRKTRSSGRASAAESCGRDTGPWPPPAVPRFRCPASGGGWRARAWTCASPRTGASTRPWRVPTASSPSGRRRVVASFDTWYPIRSASSSTSRVGCGP